MAKFIHNNMNIYYHDKEYKPIAVKKFFEKLLRLSLCNLSWFLTTVYLLPTTPWPLQM